MARILPQFAASAHAFAGERPGSDQLREQGPGRNGDRIRTGEAVDFFERTLEADLKRMGGARRLLEVAERIRCPPVAGLDLREEPRFSVARDEEIDLALLLVAQVEEFERSQAQVRPPFDRLEQVAGGERFVSGNAFASVVFPDWREPERKTIWR